MQDRKVAMTVKRIHRKRTLDRVADIQEATYDPFRDFQGGRAELLVARFFYHVRQNIRSVLIGTAIVVVGLAGYVVYDIYTKSREEKALLAYETLMRNPVMTGAADVGAAIGKLDEYTGQYSTKLSRRRAVLKKVALYEQAGKQKEAAEQAMEAARLLESDSARLYMYAKAAALYEDAQDYGRTLEACEQGLKLISDDGQIRASLLFAQARSLQKLGKSRDAEETLKALLRMDEKAHPDIGPVKQAALITLLGEKSH